VLTLGPAAPPGDEPAWTVDIDFAAGTFVLLGTAGAVPDDLERALNLLAPHPSWRWRAPAQVSGCVCGQL